MRDYEDLVKSLRYCAEYDCTTVCPRAGTGNGCITRLKKEAADAIEELSRENRSLADTVNKADEIIRNRGGKWISVEERLPEIGQKVLVVGRYKKAVYTGTYNGGQKMKHKKENPYKIITGGNGWRTFTYWMPLPEPPKEEKE